LTIAAARSETWRGHQARPRPLEIQRQVYGVDHDGGLSGQVAEQRQVGSRQLPAGRHLDGEVAQPFAAVR